MSLGTWKTYTREESFMVWKYPKKYLELYTTGTAFTAFLSRKFIHPRLQQYYCDLWQLFMNESERKLETSVSRLHFLNSVSAKIPDN